MLIAAFREWVFHCGCGDEEIACSASVCCGDMVFLLYCFVVRWTLEDRTELSVGVDEKKSTGDENECMHV